MIWLVKWNAFSFEQFKTIIQHYKLGIVLKYAEIYMPGYKHNHGLKLWFPPELYDGGAGPRLNDDTDLKL